MLQIIPENVLSVFGDYFVGDDIQVVPKKMR